MLVTCVNESEAIPAEGGGGLPIQNPAHQYIRRQFQNYAMLTKTHKNALITVPLHDLLRLWFSNWKACYWLWNEFADTTKMHLARVDTKLHNCTNYF